MGNIPQHEFSASEEQAMRQGNRASAAAPPREISGRLPADSAPGRRENYGVGDYLKAGFRKVFEPKEWTDIYAGAGKRNPEDTAFDK